MAKWSRSSATLAVVTATALGVAVLSCAPSATRRLAADKSPQPVPTDTGGASGPARSTAQPPASSAPSATPEPPPVRVAESAGSADPAAASPALSAAPADPPTPAASASASAQAACLPLDPRFCRSAALDAELSALSHGNNEAYSNFPSVPGCPLAIQDLSPVESKPSVPPPGEDRYGFVGNHDLDGDGREDMVLGYGAVDYWRWILFVRRGACFAYVGSVDGYVVELVAARHHGMRDLSVLSYPIMGRLEHYAFDGRNYVLTSAQPL